MSWRLKTHSKVPPGEFIYEEPDFKKRSGPDIGAIAKELGEFRKANKRPPWDFATCVQEIDYYNCQRLGFSPRWCMNTDANYADTTPIIRRTRGHGCGTCGAKVR